MKDMKQERRSDKDRRIGTWVLAALVSILSSILFIFPFSALGQSSQWQWPRNSPYISYNDYSSDNTCSYGSCKHAGIDVHETSSLIEGPVFAVADGVVEKIFRCTPTTTYPYCVGGEGPLGDNNNMQNVVIVRHSLPLGGSIYNGGTVYSLYAHLKNISSSLFEGQIISRGTQLGTTGVRERGGTWLTHVHLEIKNQPVRHNPSGNGQYWGYTPDSPNNYGYWDPWIFIHTISGISPNQESAGTEVIINGSKFNSLSEAANAKIYFGGSQATVLSYSDTQIRVTAPAGDGTVHVRLVPTKYFRYQSLPEGIKNWMSFTYAPPATPDIRTPITSIDFGNVNVNSNAEKTTTIYNDGNATLTINSITRSSGSSEFTYISPSTPFNISANSSRTITVKFSPTSSGSKSAVFNVNSNDPNEASVTFSVSGTGVTPPDITPPTVTITSPTSNPTYSTSSSPINLGGTASDNVGVTQVTWRNDRGGSGTCSGTTSWSCSGIMLFSGENVLTVTARDAAGKEGTDTLRVTYTPPDITPPTVPSNLTASAVSSSQINLSWGASSDSGGSGLAGYKIERCTGSGCTSFSPIDTTTSTSYSDRGLSASTTYTYRVRAYDNAGNNSGYSNIAPATTQAPPGVLFVTPPDGLASSGNQGGPFTPLSKTYTLQNTGGSSINWTASKGQRWVTLSSTGGTLAADASTTVTVSINSDANSLTPNTYSDTVSFTNTTNGNGNQTRSVSLTVNALSCTYSIYPISQPFSASGGTDSVSVTAPSGCRWTATSNASWITITSGSSGSGNGTVNYSVSANTSTSSRTGTITITGGNTFTVTQAGTTAPDITVTPTNIPFGNVNAGSSSERTVLIRNDGNANLTIGTITNPSSPFSKVSDGCSGQTLSQSASCTITVRFSPISTGPFDTTFNIPSNDPDENPVTVALTGTGTIAGTPDITVLPATTLSFPNISVGATADQTLTVKNEGTANLTIFSITSPSLPFSIVTDTCSNITLAPTKSCTIIAKFAPTASGLFNSNFNIPSNDPDENPISVGLSGSATPVTNNPPTKPNLTYPKNGSTGMPTTLTLKWDKSTDPDGDTITYKLYIGTDPSFTGVNPIILASMSSNISYAGVSGYQIGVIALFGIIAIGGLSKKRKRIGFLIVTLIFAGGLLLGSCGGGGGGGGSSSGGGDGTPEATGVSYTVKNLQTGTTYYWKVVADDGNGGMMESDIYSFKTGQ